MILNLKVKTIFNFKGSNHNYLYRLAHCFLSIIIIIVVVVVFFFSYSTLK